MLTKGSKELTNPLSEDEKRLLNNMIGNIKKILDGFDIDSSYPHELESKSYNLTDLLNGFNEKVLLLNQTKLLSENIINDEINNIVEELMSLGTIAHDYTKIKRSINNISTILQLSNTDTSIIEPTDITKVIHDDLPDVIKLPRDWTGYKYDEEDVNMIYGLPVVIAAGTGVGKTTFMTNLVYQYFKNSKANGSKYNQWVFTLESKVQRLLIELLNIELKDIQLKNTQLKSDTINFINTFNNRQEHLEKIKKYAETITFYGNDNMSKDVDIDMIEKSIRLASLKGKIPDIVYIDYLQKIKNDPLLINSDRRMQIMDTMGRLTQLAKMYNFVIIINSQINRTDRKEKTQINSDTGNTVTLPPDLTSMSESSSIEHDAGLVLAVGREFSPEREANDIFYIKIAQNRYGRTGKTYYCKVDKKTKYVIGYESGFKANIKSKSKSSE